MFAKRFLKTLSLPLTIMCLSSTWFEADARVYVVKKGDTLSGIINELLPGAVWGSGGNLNKVLAINPKIKDPQIIFPNQKITLDEADAASETVAETRPRSEPESEPEVDNKTLERKLAQASNESQNENERVFQQGSNFELTPYYRFLSLSSQDNASGANARISSSYNFGVNFKYAQNWSEQFKTDIHFDLGAIAFEAPTSGTVTLTNTSKLLTAGGIGATQALTSSTRLGVFADYEKLLFLRAANANSITVDAVSSPVLGANFSWDFIKADPFILGITLKSAVDLPATSDTFSTQTGITYGGKFYFTELAKQDSSNRFESSFGFYRRSQNTTITHQTETDVVLTFSLFFSGTHHHEGHGE